MKHTTESPLYSALLQTLQQLENIKKESSSSEIPLYEESSSVIPYLIDPDNIVLFIISYSSDVQFPAAPICTEIKVKKRSLHSLITGTNSWDDLWSEKINGEAYLMTKSKGGQDVAIVYKYKQPQHQSQIIRYYPDYTSPKAYEFVLPGSNKVQSFTIHNDSLVYSLNEGFYQYHYMKINKVEDSYELSEIEHGDLINRTLSSLTEVTGVRIFYFNDTQYLMVSKVVKTGNFATARVLVNLHALENDTWRPLGNLYNISISEHVPGFDKSFDLITLPRVRISNSDSAFVGHYDNILMYIRYIEESFEAYYIFGGFSTEFSSLDITENGNFAILVTPNKAIPGYYERERLRFIRVNSSLDNVKESFIDIALDHLPYSLMEKRMENLKFLEYNDNLYVIIFYSNGASVVIEFNNEISLMVNEELDEGYFNKAISLFVCLALAFYGLYGRRIMIRRINN